jgi:hypothetical protein
MPEPVFMKLCMFIMATEPISTAYFTNPSNLPMCLYVYPSYCCKATARLSVSLQRLCKHVPETTNARCNSRIVGRLIFYGVRVLSKSVCESACACP